MPRPVTLPCSPAIPTVSDCCGAVACRTAPTSSPASQNEPVTQSSAGRLLPVSIAIALQDVPGPAGVVELNAFPALSPATQTPAVGHDIDWNDPASGTVTAF